MRRRRHAIPLANDSFLDIVSNVVGVMILVAIVVLVNSGGMKIALGTPVLREPPKDAERVLFECSRNGVVRLDEGGLHEEINKALQARIDSSGSKIDVDAVPTLLDASDVGNTYYRARAEVESGLKSEGGRIGWVRRPVWIFERRASATGEDGSAIRRPESEFRKAIVGLDPAKSWLFFVVRDDSFEVFRTARKIAIERGLSVGWHPMQGSRPLRFGSGGGLGNRVQ